MRIGLVTETFLPKIDGVVNTLCHLLDHLSRCGHTSLLFAPQGGPSAFASTPVIGLRGYRFPLYQEISLVPPTVDLRVEMRAFRPDVVHLLNPISFGVAGLYAARSLNLPIVASYHTDLPGFAARWGFGWLYRPMYSLLRWIHDKCDLNLCPSHYTRNELSAQGFQRLLVWTRGVDAARFNPLRRTGAWRHRLSGGTPDAPLLLYVGRLSPEKRIDWIRPVLDAVPNARLAIVGDGPARAELERHFAGTNTCFTGFLRGDDLADAYAAGDIFVFPAANETFGNVVLEAMASGLPVVGAHSGGVLDNIIHEQNGLLFDPNDPDTLVHQTERLLREPALVKQLASAARCHAETRNWSEVLDDLIDSYGAVVEHHRLPAFNRAASRLYRKLQRANARTNPRELFERSEQFIAV